MTVTVRSKLASGEDQPCTPAGPGLVPEADTGLIDALRARHGIVCLAGAGGKKTTMYRLARTHPGRMAITATARLPVFPAPFAGMAASAPDAELCNVVPTYARDQRIVPYAGPEWRKKRYAGVAPDVVAELHAACAFDVTLVKADGARMRLLKTWNEDEPAVVANATTVILLASVHAIGRPLSAETVHRPELFAGITGLDEGGTILPVHVAALIAHQVAALSAATAATVVPVLNMADDGGLHDTARDVARAALDRGARCPHIVVSRMLDADPVVDLVPG